MIPPVPNIRAFLAQPHDIPEVKAGDIEQAGAENVIRNFITEQGRNETTNGVLPASVIGVFKVLGKEGDRVEGIRQFNAAGPLETPVFQDTSQQFNNIFDNEGTVSGEEEEDDEIILARWDSVDSVWYVIGGCESDSSDSSDSSSSSSGGCKLSNCCNYWGVVTEVDEEGNVTRANVYEHAGGFVAEIDELLDWVECELLVGDIVAIDTDYECYPKILMDPCLAVRRACGSSSDAGGDSSGE